MVPSRFLPERGTLTRLLAAAGFGDIPPEPVAARQAVIVMPPQPEPPPFVPPPPRVASTPPMAQTPPPAQATVQIPPAPPAQATAQTLPSPPTQTTVQTSPPPPVQAAAQTPPPPPAQPTRPAPPMPPVAELDDAASAKAVFGDTLTGSIDARLSVFIRWLMAGTGAFAAFVADVEGLALANHNAPEGYVAAVGALKRAQQDISRYAPFLLGGSTTMEVDDHNILQVVWADTSVGPLAVGLVLAGALDHAMVARVRQLTRLAITST